MEKKIKISCLPNAGINNPYQYLMINGLNKDKRIEAVNGNDNKFYGIILTVIKQKPDFLHFDWITSYYYRKNLILTLISIPLFFLQIKLIKVFTKTQIVWTLHNILPHDLPHKKLHVLCQKFLAKHCKFIRVFYAGTIEKANKFLKLDISKYIIVPEGSYVNYYLNNCSMLEARQKLNIHRDYKKVYLYLGLIRPYKGIIELVRLFKLNFNDDCLLILTGKSLNKDYYNKIVKECEFQKNILLNEGFIQPENLQYYFKVSNIVVLPFKKIENSGSAILAMGFRKTIIAPNKGVLKNRLNYQKEFLYTDDMKNIFIDSINISNERLNQIGENNYNNLLKYDWTDFAKFYL